MAKKVTPIPEGYHSVTPNIVIRGASEAIEFYKKAFGAKQTFRMDRPDGKIIHATIQIGDSIVMLCDECAPHKGHDSGCVRSPEELKGTTANFFLYVDDADKVFAKAVKAGATVRMPPNDMFWGDRLAMLQDPFGHSWAVATQQELVSPKELKKRSVKFFADMQEKGGCQ